MTAAHELTPSRVAPNRGDIEWCGLKALPVIAATFGATVGVSFGLVLVALRRGKRT